MRALRNAAVVAVLAAVVAFAPAGGNAADTVVTAILIGFLAAISWTIFGVARRNELTLAALADSRRALLYAALGVIVLLIAGSDEMFSSGLGTLAWILLLGAAVVAIWRVWVEAHSY